MSGFDPSSVTVADALAWNMDAIEASCDFCGNVWRAPIDFLPRAISVQSVAELMVCPLCGGRGVKITSPWPNHN